MLSSLLNDVDKKHLRRSFLFFFCVAVCAYLSIMVLFSPHGDDHARHIYNYGVGNSLYFRVATRMVELLTFFSYRLAFDTVPFFTLLSCGILACIAIICRKILDLISDNECSNDKFVLLCFIPIIVNPYLAEAMIFRFDTPFMMIPLLCVMMAVYLAVIEQYAADSNLLVKNFGKWRLELAQIALLLLSLLFYQTAISTYFTLFAYVCMTNLTEKKSLWKILMEMRHWFSNIFITLAIYLLILAFGPKKTLYDEFSAVLPKNFTEIINNVINNAIMYFCSLYTDWSCNAVGILFFTMLVIFFLSLIYDIWKKSNGRLAAALKNIILYGGMGTFLLGPFTACLPLDLYQHNVSGYITPRVLYTFGILMALVLYKNYMFLAKQVIIKNIYRFFLITFGIWSISYMNAFGNIMHMQFLLEDKVAYELANDLH
ncbi:MAG: glucosyltransferase domain-containing protein, partial [Holosporaceae bacterium]|nr:glucosyltransferase domain-containing protein [Holosporaceae bacterium]